MANNLKIMFVLPSLAGGGAERVVVILAEALTERGHEVTIVTLTDDLQLKPAYNVPNGVKYIPCFELKDYSYVGGWKGWLKHLLPRVYSKLHYEHHAFKTHFVLRKVIKSAMPDIIVGLELRVPTQTLIANHGTGIPVISSDHNSFERPASAPMKMVEWIDKFVANKWFPAVTVLTEADKAFIGNKLKNVYVMPNPLALKIADNNNQLREKRIVAAGRLGAWHYKGFDILIKAWGLIHNECPDWRVEIAGTGNSNDVDYLKGLIAENGVEDSLSLIGFQSDIAKVFKESEIFVLPSRYEGFGMVLIEAMSQGCACIAADYKGRQREIMPDDSIGLCIEPENTKQMADALLRVINDDSYRATMHEKAIERAKFYNPAGIASRWEELFNKVINDNMNKLKYVNGGG